MKAMSIVTAAFSAVLVIGSPGFANEAEPRSHMTMPSVKKAVASPKTELAVPVSFSPLVNELSFSFGQESYLNRATPPAGITDYTQISGRLRTHGKRGNFIGYFEFAGSFATDIEKYTNLEVPEVYLGAQGERGSVMLGRKIENWSSLDTDWLLGLWQPTNRFDGLRPNDQGLTGAFFTFKHQNFSAILFASPMYIPEQRASYEIENNKITSKNPWFTSPPDKMTIGDDGVLADVNYRVQTPSVGSVIDHRSGGLILRYTGTGFAAEEGGFYAQASYARKPRNQLGLPFTGKFQLTSTDSYGDVVIYPEVVYHDMAGAEFGYQNDIYAMSLASLVEIPDYQATSDELTRQELGSIAMVSPSFAVRMMPSKFWGPRLKFSYLHSVEKGTLVRGPHAANDDVFDPRVPFRQALSFSAQTLLLSQNNWSLEHGLRWIEEFSESGTVLMNDLKLNMGASWRVMVSADMLGSRQSPEQTDSFISKYRGNDRVSGQVTYVF